MGIAYTFGKDCENKNIFTVFWYAIFRPSFSIN